MAVAAVAAASFPATLSEHPRVGFNFVCCLPARYKLTRKKNHLRPKILKTLNPRFLPEQIPIPIVWKEPLADSVTAAPPVEDSALEGMNGGGVVVEGESLQSVEVVRDKVRDEGGFLGEVTVKDVVKFGFWFVGCFVFQTACAVWVLGRSRGKDGGNDGGLKEAVKSVDGREKGQVSALYGNGGLSKVGSAGYVGRVDVEKRIEEIRSMAREARRIEKRGSQDGGDDREGEDDADEDKKSSSGRTDIEKEIDARLEKLRKQFKSVQKSGASASTGSQLVERVNGVDSGLMFERKLKFRNPPPVQESSRPKGFNGGEFRGKAQKKKRSGATVVIGVDGKMKESEKMKIASRNAGEGEMITFGHVKSKVGDVGGKSGENIQKLSQVRAKISGDLPSAVMHIPSNKSERVAGSKKVEGSQFIDANDQWWLSLPCVFAILMTRGPDSENPNGLFTLKIFSQDNNDDDTDDDDDGDTDDDDDGVSYVIAFEHRNDASNFCYLLDSFFEDLGDFGADIVPLLKNDLLEMVREQVMKIFVVRKGELQLYAGQPFREVEATLKSMIQGNQR